MTAGLRGRIRDVLCPRPWLAWGVVAGALYVGAVVIVSPLPVLVLYDGLAPLPPYRWVHPPSARAKDNEAPASVTGMLTFGSQGSQASEMSTPDDQALVTFPATIIEPRPGAVKVTLTPLDPATIAPAPKGQSFDGNAYRIDAQYTVSSTPAVITGSVTVVLRYAVHGTQTLRNDDQGWAKLPTTRFDGSQQLLANSDRLGVFVAAGAQRSRRAPGTPERAYIAAGAGLLAAALGRLISVRAL